ncbi:MAG: hypothetical protein KC466_05445 [Myxococcales bacterium]|nr:hypothetical protein [Myxococcales bacterium]
MTVGVAQSSVGAAKAPAFRWLASNPAKRATERFHLFYAPVWGVAVGAVMMTGIAERWGDAELLTFSLVIFAGSAFGPFVWAAPTDRGRPLTERYAFKILVWVSIFSILGNYFGTAFFYEVLHAHYGFQTQWNWNHVPLPLYLLTVAYFSTYVVLVNIGWRLARDWVRPRAPALFWPAAVAAPFVVAGLESALNANPWMRGLYCFDEPVFALSFGTLAYGLQFLIAMPFWIGLDETPGKSQPVGRVVVGALAAYMMIFAANEFLKECVAPNFTVVAHGHVGLRDYAGSCLKPPGR